MAEEIQEAVQIIRVAYDGIEIAMKVGSGGIAAMQKAIDFLKGMVTQAEYGAEIEAETSEKDPSELQYITPIDYAKRIAELDEDLRDVAEILVTDCSCYTPFRAFLMDVVQSDFAFMPNKLDLIRDIALGTDNAERKAYSNNKYGLVEYSIRSGYVKISYKNRNGVRKEGALDWRELYEILSYMVKQPFYCGEDQKKYYQETKQKADRDKMNPVYKRFFDIEDSVKANRLETRERAIANGWETKIDENGHVVSDDAVSVSVEDIQADTESQETVDFTPKQEPVQQVGSLENEKNVAGQTKHNFHYNLWEMEKGGAKTRYQWNMDAIRTLKQIESENRLATPEEQKVLSKFVGWGGLSQAFDEENAGWSKEYVELKELLSDEEYSAARATVNNAFYTSSEIAMCMNSALVQFGFRGGNVLEPSMGIGNFFGSMPETMHEAKLYGVELDSISGRIAKQLYQNANISITGFENTTYPDNFFDVVVGNVPFGDYKVFDPKYNKYNFRIHDYFLAKALDQVRPGGMVAVITTKGTLDKANPTIRKYLAERAELVGAVRLPNTAFKANAGAEVTTDILFLQKRERKIDIEPDWVHLGMTENGIAVNSYFAEHPEMMLGSMEYDTRIYGQDSRYTVCVNDDENFNMYEALNKAIGNIKAQMTDFERVADEAKQTEEVIPADPDVRNYTYTFFEGKLYYRENSEMVRKEVSKTAEERIRCLDEIRQITRELIDIQMKGCSEEEISDKQRLLLNNIPMDKDILRKWLKCGVIFKGELYKTEEGTMQGGIISPTLANMALDGIQPMLAKKYYRYTRNGKQYSPMVNLVRYADDFIITSAERDVLEKEIKPMLVTFLAERGLELSEEKTLITHIDDGFDFLGFNVRKYNNVLLIKPSKKCVKKFLDSIRYTIESNKSCTQETMIRLLNPKITGWAKLDNLAMNVQLDKEKHMENAKVQEQTEPERAEADRVEAEVVYSPMVAEPQEYQYNADAFEARGVDEVKQEAAHEEAPKVREDKAR